MGFLDDKAIEKAKGFLPGQKGKDSGGLSDILGNASSAGGGVTSKLGGLFGGGGNDSGGGGVGGALGGLFGGGGDSGGDGGGGLGGLLGGFPPGGDGGSSLDQAATALGKDTTSTGKPTKIHESPEAATKDLLTGKPKEPTQGHPMDESSSVGEASAFGTTHIRKWVRNEFIRREQNFGMRYTHAGEFADNAYQVMETSKGSGEFTDEYKESLYRGPKAAWMRVISNAIGPDPDNEDGKIYGFEMHGWHGKNDLGGGNVVEDPVGFHEQYGFDKASGQSSDEAKTYLGRGWAGEGKGAKMVRHEIKEENFMHRPSPGVTSISSEDKEPGKNYRETTVNFTVWSRNQLDYMDKYFFKVGVTCCTEWGWNTYPRNGVVIDPTDLGTNIERVLGRDLKEDAGKLTAVNNLREIDEGKLDKLQAADIEDNAYYRTKGGTGMIGLFTDPVSANNHLKSGKGNYSFTIGMISNYSYNLRDDGGYDCEIKITSMAKIAAGLDNQSTTEEPKDKENPDERQRDFKMFIEEKLDEILGGDQDPNEFWDGFDQGIDDISAAVASPEFSKGRYFQFDQSNGGKETYHSDHEDSYITLGYLIDIVNKFFEKTSKETNIGAYAFEIGNSRCCAHPNIKSTDGKVLLIPNAMSPRRNNKKSERTDGYQISSGLGGTDENTEINQTIKSAIGGSAESVVQTLNASLSKGSPASNLDETLKRSPRDNLHLPLSSANRAFAGIKGWSPVKPFPDFATINGKPTLGYSGKIENLFVNYNVIRDAVSNGSNITEMLKDILKKVSDAAGGIWDFDLVGPNTSSPNDTKVAIVDRRFPGMTTAYDIQKDDQSYRFQAHTKNSIIKGMSLDVSVATEVAGMVVFAEPEPHPDDAEDAEDTDDSGDNPQSSFYARGREDRLLKQCDSPQKTSAKKVLQKPEKESSMMDTLLGWTPLVDTEEEIESEEKFIIGSPSSFGRWNADHDIEMVDPNKNRMVRSMKKDDNKLNCVKNNMPLDGCEISLQLDGIEGLRLLDVFSCTGVPTHYFMNGLWRIQSVAHSVTDNNWITDIKGEYIPSVKQK